MSVNDIKKYLTTEHAFNAFKKDKLKLNEKFIVDDYVCKITKAKQCDDIYLIHWRRGTETRIFKKG